MSKWRVHGERTIYDSDWVRLALVDVELPDGSRFEHHVVRATADAAAVVARDPDRGVLVIRRHRFITDTWGWEVPAGRVDGGETPAEAAAREMLEETGWRPGALRPLGAYHPSNGLSDQRFHVFVAGRATEEGVPDANEAERVEWLEVDRVRALLRAGEVRDGFSLTALTWALALGELR